MSSESSSVTVTPGASAAMSACVGPSGAAHVTSSHDVGSTSCTAVLTPASSRPPSAVGRPPRRRRAGRPAGPATAHDAEASPATSAGSTASRSLVAAGERQREGDHVRADERPRLQPPAPRVGDQRGVEHAVVRDAAAAERLRDQHRVPAQVGRLSAVRRHHATVSPCAVAHRTQRAGVLHEARRDLEQRRCSSVAPVSTRPPARRPATGSPGRPVVRPHGGARPAHPRGPAAATTARARTAAPLRPQRPSDHCVRVRPRRPGGASGRGGHR